MGRSNATACYRELGAELKKRRRAAGVSTQEVAEYTGWHRTKVSRVETGHSTISPVDAVLYLGACGVYRAQAMDLLKLCREAERQRGYWLSPHGEWLEDSLSALIFHESTADRMTSFEPQLVPGLLQTPGYARARISTGTLQGDEIEAAVETRMERRQIIRRPAPAQFTFFVHEQALRLQVGSAAIMHEQLLQLVLMAALDHVSLRVVPAEAGERAAFGGAFRLFEYRTFSPLIYLDNVASGIFIEDRDYVDDYRQLIPQLLAVSLDEGQSRKLAAELADEYDRGSLPNGGIYQLEEEHL